MGSNHADESAALIVVINESNTNGDLHCTINHARDAHILSFSFFFIYCAYSAAQNLESTINTKGDLGTTSLGILYTSFTIFSIVASPIVRGLGSRKALVLGTSGYLLFIASHLKPSRYTMVPASLYLGFTSSILWVSQGTYLTSAARSHARDCHLHEGAVIGSFNGEFWGFFAGTQVIGNLISLFLLGDAKEGDSTNLLYIVFLVCVILGATLICFLTERVDRSEEDPVQSSVSNILKSIISPLMEIRFLFIIPLLAYSGFQLAFVLVEFTKHVVEPALGVSGVGGAMAVFGAADVICSVVAGRLISGLSSVTWIVSGGALLQAFILLWLLFGYSLSSGILGTVYPLAMAAMWGVGDGVFNTQTNALLGLLFKPDTEAAFAQLWMWQSGAAAVVFFLSPYITLQTMIVIMIAALFVAVSGFLYLTLLPRSDQPQILDSS